MTQRTPPTLCLLCLHSLQRRPSSSPCSPPAGQRTRGGRSSLAAGKGASHIVFSTTGVISLKLRYCLCEAFFLFPLSPYLCKGKGERKGRRRVRCCGGFEGRKVRGTKGKKRVLRVTGSRWVKAKGFIKG